MPCGHGHACGLWGVGVPAAIAMAIASSRAQQPAPWRHPADRVPHGAGGEVALRARDRRGWPCRGAWASNACWGCRKPATANGRRLRGRSKAAAEQKAAARGLRRTEGGPEIEGAGARRAWGRQISPRRAAAAGPAADQHQQRARGCGSAVLPPLTGRLRPKPKCIASMALRSKEPAPERRGVVKFLHVGLLLLKLPGARSSKEQVAVRGRHSRCWPADCLSGP